MRIGIPGSGVANVINIMLTGVGGQGTVLAAKILAQAAQEKGWHVRTAETIGMAQRGGSVVSHVRMGDRGEQVHAPLIAHGTADALIAFEPAEGARMLDYLAPRGFLVTARSAIQPVTASLFGETYDAGQVLEYLQELLPPTSGRLVVVDDGAILESLGNRRALNTVLLANAIATGRLPLTLDDLRDAIRVCVKPDFVDLNLEAIDKALG